MTILVVPQLTQNQAGAPKPGQQALIDNHDMKIKDLGKVVEEYRKHIEALYNVHNQAYEQMNLLLSKAFEKLNGDMIKIISPQISEAALQLLKQDQELISLLAQAVIQDQQKQIIQYQSRLKELEGRVNRLEAKL